MNDVKEMNQSEAPEELYVELPEKIQPGELDPYSKSLVTNPWFLGCIAKGIFPFFWNWPLQRIVQTALEKGKKGEVIVHRPEMDMKSHGFKKTEKSKTERADGKKKTVAHEVFPDVLIQEMNTESSSMSDGTIRLDALYNICVKESEAASGELFILHIDFQKKPGALKNAINRSFYYMSRLISMQKGTTFTGMDFQGLRPVYSVWIYFDYPENQSNSIGVITPEFTDLVGHMDIPAELMDLFKIYLIRVNIHEDQIPVLTGNESPQELLLKTLNMTFNTKIPRDNRERFIADIYHIKTSTEKKGITSMLGLSEALAEAYNNELNRELNRKLNQELNRQAQAFRSQLAEKDSQINEKDSQINEKDNQIADKDSQIQNLANTLQTAVVNLHRENFSIQAIASCLNLDVNAVENILAQNH